MRRVLTPVQVIETDEGEAFVVTSCKRGRKFTARTQPSGGEYGARKKLFFFSVRMKLVSRRYVFNLTELQKKVTVKNSYLCYGR